MGRPRSGRDDLDRATRRALAVRRPLSRLARKDLSDDRLRAIVLDSVRLDAGALILTTRQPEVVLSRLAAEGRLAGLQVHGASLEDVFLDLTGREFRS